MGAPFDDVEGSLPRNHIGEHQMRIMRLQVEGERVMPLNNRYVYTKFALVGRNVLLEMSHMLHL
jgi:DNA mismatch repair protein MutH